MYMSVLPALMSVHPACESLVLVEARKGVEALSLEL